MVEEGYLWCIQKKKTIMSNVALLEERVYAEEDKTAKSVNQEDIQLQGKNEICVNCEI